MMNNVVIMSILFMLCFWWPLDTESEVWLEEFNKPAKHIKKREIKKERVFTIVLIILATILWNASEFKIPLILGIFIEFYIIFIAYCLGVLLVYETKKRMR